MNISETGISFIKSFEAYMKKLPDGGCTAYQEVIGHKDGKPILDIPTIGWGCTEGVKMGDVWTKEQAEAALLSELAKHEKIVNRIVTVALSQSQFDALVSFNYNCGKLAGSTLLKLVNQEKFEDAAQQFSRFTKAQGQVLKGLVRRRAGEKAMFLTSDEEEHTPQQADTPKKELTTGQIVGAATTAAGGAVHVANQVLAQPVSTHVETSQKTRQTVTSAKEEVTAWAGLASEAKALVGLPGLFLGGAVIAAFLLYKVMKR